MRVLIWFIAIFGLAVGLVMLLGHDWGYVQFMLPERYRVQMPLNLFAALLVIAFVVGYLLTRLIRHTLALPEAVGQWRERRRRQRADRALREAVLTLHEGRYTQALKCAGKAFAASDHPAAAALLAARAAHALRDKSRYRDWIGHLEDEEGEKVQVARLMTEAELAIAVHDFEEAAQKLEILREDGHRHIAALRLALRVATALRHWEDVLRLTRQLRKHKALTEAQALPLLRRAHVECLRECAGNSETLAQAWNDIPAAERADPRLLAEAIPLLAHTGKGSIARRTLERQLDDEWDSGLARLYGHCGGSDGDSALAKGESWLAKHPRDAGLLFALGRLCLAAQLWGKAESYFGASLGLHADIETHLALARLFERLERGADAQRHYRAAAELVAA
ncbi:MAG: heme biosynthesis protein HemY [Azoarcus sp.]|jgi:HemY protein|nr:heme biosynthesis protein HemY [Azoarcus sp.]